MEISKTKTKKLEISSLAVAKPSISKTKIEKRMRQKTNPLLVETIVKLKKTNPTILQKKGI